MNYQKIKNAFALAATGLSALSTLIELGKKYAPEIKKALGPVIEKYKNVSNKPQINSTQEVEKVEQA